MAIKIWDGSKWAMVSQLKTWDGSAWQNGANGNVHIWTGSAWQKIHPGANLDSSYFVSALDASGSGAQAQAELTLYSNGKIQTFESTTTSGTLRLSSADWLLTGANSDYDVFVTNFIGDVLVFSSRTDGERDPLSTSQTYRLIADYPDNKNCTFTLNICSNTGTGTVIQSATVSLTAEATI